MYNIDIMRQTACIFVNPITIESYAFRFNGKAIRASDTKMTVPTY